jgi:hypothetical protein
VVGGGKDAPEVTLSREFMDLLHKANWCRLRISGKMPMEWFPERGDRPKKDISDPSHDGSWGGPEHPIVWSGNSFSVAYTETRITDKVRGGPMRDRGYDQTLKYEVALTGTFDPKTATIVSIRGVTTTTTDWVLFNYPSKGPPGVLREALEFRNLGPLAKESNGTIRVNKYQITPEVLKQHLVEMTKTSTDPTAFPYKFYPGTGDPKVCRVDIDLSFFRQ